MSNKGQFPPGVSGNPRGRPPKSRALTDLLTKALGRTLETQGKKVSGKRLLARLVVDVLTTGRATFPDGRVLEVAPKDWLEFAKWLYQHVDGPARQELDVTSGGQPLKGYVVISPDDWPDDSRTV